MKQVPISSPLLLILFVTLACNFSSVLPIVEPPSAPTEPIVAECEISEPTAKDVDEILSFYKRTFDSPGWERSYTVLPDRVAITWMNDDIGGLAYSENLIYSCGGAHEDINAYLNRESFAIIFSDYDSYQETEFCQIGELRLYQFDVVNQGLPYQIRYWAEPQSDTRVFITMLVFPTGSPQMDEYATSLYPRLDKCR